METNVEALDEPFGTTLTPPSSSRYEFRRHGDGAANPNCGKLCHYGHRVDDRAHIEGAVSWCNRWECPVCALRTGAIVRESDRILRGLFPGATDPHESDPVEVVMSVQCDPEMLYESSYVVDLLRRTRKAYGIIGPGAAVLHTRLTDPLDRCPSSDHFHLFLSRAPTLRGMIPAVTLGPVRKPGVRDVLRVSTRPCTPGSRYLRRKWVVWIRWWGRRGAPRLARDAAGKPVRPQKVRHCQLCARDVPRSEWMRLTSRTEVLTETGWLERPWAEVVWVTWREDR